MSTKKGLVNGKVKDSHSTYIEEAVWIVEAAKKIASVKSINPGRINGRGGSVIRTLKIVSRNGGILLIVKGSTASQELHVYLQGKPDLLAVSQEFEEAWETKLPDEKKRKVVVLIAV